MAANLHQFVNKVRQTRRKKGLSLQALADIAGVHFTTIAKIERFERRLSLEMLQKLADALEVEPGDLLEHVPTSIAVRMVPIVGKISAGKWQEAIEVPDGWMATPVGGANAFALRPDGDSMDLVVGKDALIVIDPDDVDLLDGRLYAVMNGDGETTFKRFRLAPPRLEPVSSNPNHKSIKLGAEPFTTIGRVIWQGSTL